MPSRGESRHGDMPRRWDPGPEESCSTMQRDAELIALTEITPEMGESTVVLPPERFSNAYAPADPNFASERRGADAEEIDALLSTCCAGWKQVPTSREFYEAMGTPEPTQREETIINVLITEAPNDVVALAFLQGAFTWRQLAAAMRRRGHYSARLAQYINLHAQGSR